LSEVAQTFGIPCEVAANLTTARIHREISNGRYAILSVDLKVTWSELENMSNRKGLITGI